MGLRGVVDCAAIVAFICAIGVFVGHVIAFATHFWLESKPGHSEFRNLGMHECCFDGYRHPRGDFNTRYRNCYGYWDDYYLQIRAYLLPDWFLKVRMLVFANLGVAIFTFFFGVVCFLIMIMDRCLKMKCGTPCEVFILFTTGAAFLATGLIDLLAVAQFYSNCFDRDWMPRPEMNHLSYSFWAAVGVTVVALIGFIACVIGAIMNILHSNERKDDTQASDRILSRH